MGAADLVALAPYPVRPRLIQVKRNAYLSKAERTNLNLLKRYGIVECWRFVGRGKPLIEIL